MDLGAPSTAFEAIKAHNSRLEASYTAYNASTVGGEGRGEGRGGEGRGGEGRGERQRLR